MEAVVTAEEMRRADRATIEKIGIPALVLMERAALAVLEEIVHSGRRGRVVILAGCGNNGGDGLALARLLCEREFGVDVVICGNEDKATPEWRTQREILRHYPVSVCGSGQRCREKAGKSGSNVAPEEPGYAPGEYTIAVDALFGVGLSREIVGEYKVAVEWFNDLSAFKIAVDVPSGIHSDSGRVMGCCVRADVTLCLGYVKRGVLLYPGCSYCGEVKKKEIGLWKDPEMSFGMFRYTENTEELLPPRDRAGNKGSFGKVLLIAGRKGMAGAAILAARSCYRSGAGMVKVATADCNRVILQTAVPEALLYLLPDRDAVVAEEELEWADVVAIGPGLGTDDWAATLLRTVLFACRKPIVIDADGLNLLAYDAGLQEELAAQAGEGRAVILTPHMGELSRLCGETIAGIKEHPAQSIMETAKRFHCVVVGKDARTMICRENSPVCLNTCGNDGMATAGSGDVLAGLLAGLLAQGEDPFVAAGTGVCLHGRAGEEAARRRGRHGMTAMDIVDCLGRG